MSGVLPFIVALCSLPILAVFFWIWWSLPKDKVAPHLSRFELKHLETEDRLRQTSYQILTAFALVATFIVTIAYVSVNSQQWSADHDLRVNQERMTHFTEAIKAMAIPGNVTAHVAGIYSLGALALWDPSGYHRLVIGTLSQTVRALANKDIIEQAGMSAECIGWDGPYSRPDREEADPEVQAAMTILGDRKVAEGRGALFRPKDNSCVAKSGNELGTFSLRLVRAEHLYLDDLELSYSDFSCALMSQSKFRRTSFYGATLHGTDFRGATFADHSIPGARSQTKLIGNWLYSEKGEEGVDREPTWRRYRCWVADFRTANLQGANFEGADLSGADFGGADLTNAALRRTNLSRVNLAGVKGLTEEQLKNSCSGPDAPVLDANFTSVKLRDC